MLSEWDHRNRRGKALKQQNMETLNRRGRTGWGGCREEEHCLSSIQSAVPFLNLRICQGMRKTKGGFPRTCPPSNRRLPWESGAEDARTPSASRLLGGSGPREASGVRPIYRRSFSMNRLIRSADSQLPPFNLPVFA